MNGLGTSKQSGWDKVRNNLPSLSDAAKAAGTAGLAAGTAAGGAAGAGTLIAAQDAAAATTDLAQIANIKFMTHNTLNGIMMENFGAVMETLLKTSKLGAKTLTKSVPDPA